tara:strand:+ start:58 stop:762 length:705 start_codon:yes stop_codon:yes gene_type:complete
MAVNIDTVYQRVLALANKEQRGYITPQEFNLFANHAQMEIFEQYFYDLNQFLKAPGNNTSHSDVDDMLYEKLQFLERVDDVSTIGAYASNSLGLKILPNYVYRVNKVSFNNADCEILNTKDFNNLKNGGPLITPTAQRPVVNISNSQAISCLGFPVPTEIIYFKIPIKAQWAYVIVNEKPLWNPALSVNFELHPSEEVELVYKILKLAGVNIKSPEVVQVAQALETNQVQQEKQ